VPTTAVPEAIDVPMTEIAAPDEAGDEVTAALSTPAVGVAATVLETSVESTADEVPMTDTAATDAEVVAVATADEADSVADAAPVARLSVGTTDVVVELEVAAASVELTTEDDVASWTLPFVLSKTDVLEEESVEVEEASVEVEVDADEEESVEVVEVVLLDEFATEASEAELAAKVEEHLRSSITCSVPSEAVVGVRVI